MFGRMFEIGTNLREARRRQGLELDDAVRATLIRADFPRLRIRPVARRPAQFRPRPRDSAHDSMLSLNY